MKKKTDKTKGQSLVETALVLPILLLLVFTFLDLGRAVYYYSAIGNAVRDGARYASVNKLTTQAERDAVAAVVNNYSVRVTPDVVKVCPFDSGDIDCYCRFVDNTAAGCDAGIPSAPVCIDDEEGNTDCVVVIAEYQFDPVTPYLAQILGSGNSITLSSESTMLLAPIARN